jgi:mono/diheme cytochrome c family protein
MIAVKLVVRAGIVAALLLCVAARLPAQQADPPDSLVARGDSLYHAGTCPACHASDGTGIGSVAPSLVDGKWLHATNRVASIERVIEVGVEKPKKVASPMPPNGGMALTPEQRHALAAYLLSLRHTPSR